MGFLGNPRGLDYSSNTPRAVQVLDAKSAQKQGYPFEGSIFRYRLTLLTLP